NHAAVVAQKKIWHLQRLDRNAWRWWIGQIQISLFRNRPNCWALTVPVFIIHPFSHHRRRWTLNIELTESIPSSHTLGRAKYQKIFVQRGLPLAAEEYRAMCVIWAFMRLIWDPHDARGLCIPQCERAV